MATLLDIRNLETHFFTDEGVVKAVDGVSYDVQEGETLGIVGESGCGKSVGAMSVMRLIPEPPGKIVGGEVIFEGEDLLAMDIDEMRHIRGNKIGMIFQEPMTSLNPVLTIARQMAEPLQLHHGLTYEQARNRAVELMQLVGIPGAETRVDDYPHQFSGGMRQRVMIAIGLSCNPRLLIADEPTTALDVTIQAQVLEVMQAASVETGTAVMVITHNLGVVARYAHRVNVMYAGRMAERGSAMDIYHDPKHPYTLGLLQSVPRLDAMERERLHVIEGLPPDLINMPQGCPFMPRCPFATEQCNETPPLREVADGHLSACWFADDLDELNKKRIEKMQRGGI